MTKTPVLFKSNNLLIIWTAILFGLTALAVVWLRSAGVNPDTGFSPAIIIIAYAPSLAALLALGWAQGRQGMGQLLQQMLVWRVHIGWYVVSFLGPLALVLIATALYVVFGGSAPAQWLAVPAAGDIGGLIGPLIAGSIGEELGWRGFAQRLLQMRYSLLWASVIVGLLWATWHSWPLLAPGGAAHAHIMEVLETYVRLVATAVIYGWIYARTRGSVLLVMLAHAGHNIAIDLMSAPLLATKTMPLIIACLYAAVAVILLIARPAHFCRNVKV